MSWVRFLNKKFFRSSPHAGSRIVSYLAIIGLSIGMATFLLTQGIFSGFEHAFFEKVLGFHAHLMLNKWDPYAKFEPQVEELWGEYDSELVASTPYLSKPSMLIYQGEIQGVVLKGVDPKSFDQVYDLQFEDWLRGEKVENIRELFQETMDAPQIVLGSDLARSLGVTKQEPYVRAYLSSTAPDEKKGRTQSFRVVGVFHTGFHEFDRDFALLRLKSLQSLFFQENELTGYDYILKNPLKSKEISKKLKVKLEKTPYYVMSWDELYAPLFKAIGMDRKIVFIVLTVVIAVAAFNIVGVLWLRIFEKRKEISILRAMGASSSSIQKLFFLQGLKIMVLGSLGALLIVSSLVFLLKKQWLFKLPKEVYLIDHVPVYFSWDVCISVIVVSFLVAMIASFIGVRRIKKNKLVL